MKWLFAIGLALSTAILVQRVKGMGGASPVDMNDEYMEHYMYKMRCMAKDALDVKYKSSFTIEPKSARKQTVNGYLIHMDFLAYGADSNGKMMTKDCKVSVHFIFDGKTDPKMTKGPQCKDV